MCPCVGYALMPEGCQCHGRTCTLMAEDRASRDWVVGYGSLLVGGFLGPAGNGRDYHADAGYGYEIACSGEPGVGACGGLPGDAEAFGELVAGRDRVAGRPLPGSDLSLDDPRDLEVPRDSRQVIKIIRHTGHPS